MAKQIAILDTTLRDGEQSPGAALDPEQKWQIAKKLEELGVDVIEAGFPASSPREFEAVKRIASEIRGSEICAFARATKGDLEVAARAIEGAKRTRIHLFISTSPIHMREKLGMTPEQVLEKAIFGVKTAREYCETVEFTAEDSARTELGFLIEVYEEAIRAGAKIINVADTVGIMTPDEFGELVGQVKRQTRGIEHATLSVHCHDDLGMATANSFAAVRAGADQVECTINGIGERAGNAALEEIAMALRLKGYETGINPSQITACSKLVSELTGIPVQPNKAIVGRNAFRHEAGIHQHGVAKCAQTYEIIDPREVGAEDQGFSLGRRSGKHGLSRRLAEIGYPEQSYEIGEVYPLFIEIADRKKSVEDHDLHLIMRSR